MPNNYFELRSLLERTSTEHRDNLGEIIGAGFGNTPDLLCDHLSFLRSGFFGQVFDRRDYKQLITDIADKVEVDWSVLVSTTSWEALSTEQIEASILHHVDNYGFDLDDVEVHIPAPIATALKRTLIALIIKLFPVCYCSGGPLMTGIDAAFSLLSTDWRKLLAATIYIHQTIRPTTAVARLAV